MTLGDRGGESDDVGTTAAEQGLGVGNRDGVAAGCQRELVAAGAQVDGSIGECGGERDDVGAGAAHEGLDVADGGRCLRCLPE